MSRILLVDDDVDLAELVRTKLSAEGHELHVIHTGDGAFEKAKEVRPEMAILDIMLPGLDGYQVCKLIRANEAAKEVPVVMISGKDGFFDKVRGRMAGTTGYITKPFGPETLMKALETYLIPEAAGAE